MAEALARMASYALRLEGVGRRFGALVALEQVSLEIQPGERRAIIGANGAGKTTLFNCITGDFPPTSGRIVFFGEDLTHLPPWERIRRGLRRTYQNSLLFRNLAVIDNLYLAARGVSRSRLSLRRPAANDPAYESARELAHHARLEHVAQQAVAELSHGQQRQLEIGMALAGAPRLILFDEPAAGLSPAERRELMALLRSLPSHTGYILIEHDLDVALSVVDYVTVMHNARILKHGTPKQIEVDPEVQAIYLGIGVSDAPLTQPVLEVNDLHVYYGHAHALQGVTLTLERGVLGVVGRNGMGKSTLCNAIMGFVPAARGSVKVAGTEIIGLPSHRIVAAGVSYVPQGRRVWPSLSVDEHLRLALRKGKGTWTIERVYQVFPPLAQRKGNGGAELSGGEQQMLAIGRALLANPRLLVMDEPTEGLAPVIVDQVIAMLKRLAAEGEISVLLIEQNLGVATTLAQRIAVMVNGRVAHETSAAQLASDRELQQRFLGVRAAEAEEEGAAEAPAAVISDEPVRVFQVRRSSQGSVDAGLLANAPAYSAARAPTLWSSPNTLGSFPNTRGASPDTLAPQTSSIAERAASGSETTRDEVVARSASADSDAGVMATGVGQISAGSVIGRNAYVAGTFDTKGRELRFIKSCLEKLGIRAITVDLSTTQRPSPADIGPGEVARFHPKGARAVFTGDRGTAVRAMAEAFERFIVTRRDLAGLISAGGSGGTSLATPAMQRLPIGVPKVMISTVASGDVKRYVGPSDICMMYSVTDVSGINRISERVLSNAAHALAGMIAWSLSAGRQSSRRETKPALGLTMFGVTTSCVQAVTKLLEDTYDCLVFHATGTGGQSMEKLVDSGLLSGVIDVSTTEVADLLMGGVFSAGEDRFGSIIRTRIPYVASCGALDMVNFGPIDTVPEHYKHRNLYQHNPSVTLMRTTPEENARMGKWLADKLNQCEGQVRFVIPEGGVSLYDRLGQPFYDPEADAALFKAITETLRVTGNRRLVRLPYNINDPHFAEALVESFREVSHGLAAA